MSIRRCLALTVILALSSLPIFGQGQNNSTYQRWTFNTDPPNHSSFPASDVDNPYGAPSGSAPGASFQATDASHVGVLIIDPTDVAAQFIEPNKKVAGYKDVTLLILYKQTGTDPLTPFVQSSDLLQNATGGNPNLGAPDADGYRSYLAVFSLSGCPDVSVKFHPPGQEALLLDDLTIWTQCHPTGSPTLSEWGTILLTLLMFGAVSAQIAWRYAPVVTTTSGVILPWRSRASGILDLAILVRSLAGAMGLAVLGLLGARLAAGVVPPTDVAGALASAAVAGYTFHLWILILRCRRVS
jgi:hypothetical protein